MTVSAHVLDAVGGGPVAGVGVRLEVRSAEGWEPVAAGRTDGRGRFGHFEAGGLVVGVYRWVFAAGEYFRSRGVRSFHPEIPVVFEVCDAQDGYHVPLLLSPYAYTTYRGH